MLFCHPKNKFWLSFCFCIPMSHHPRQTTLVPSVWHFHVSRCYGRCTADECCITKVGVRNWYGAMGKQCVPHNKEVRTRITEPFVIIYIFWVNMLIIAHYLCLRPKTLYFHLYLYIQLFNYITTWFVQNQRIQWFVSFRNASCLPLTPIYARWQVYSMQGCIFLKIQPTTICWFELTPDRSQTKTHWWSGLSTK